MGLCESKSDKKALINENNNNSEKINNPESSQINQITNSQNNSQIKEKTPNSIIKESIKSAEEKSNKNENIPSVLKSQNNISQTSGIKNSTINPLNNINSQIKTSNIENPVESRLSSVIKNNSSRMNNFSNFTCVKSFKSHNDSISHIIELDSGYVASGSYDKTINIWDLNNTEPVNTIKTSGRVFCLLEFIPGILLCGTDNSEIEMWNIKEENNVG